MAPRNQTLGDIVHITRRRYWDSIVACGFLKPADQQPGPTHPGTDNDKVSAYCRLDAENRAELDELRAAIVRAKNDHPVFGEIDPWTEEECVFLLVNEHCPGVEWQLHEGPKIELSMLGVSRDLIAKLGYVKTTDPVPIECIAELG